MSVICIHPMSPEFVPALAHAAWSSALEPHAGFGLAVGEPNPSSPNVPGYVGASINEHGQPYMHVLDEQKAAVAMALNNYNRAGSAGAEVLVGTRIGTGAAGDLVPAIQAMRGDNAIALVGDPFVSPTVRVLFGKSLPALSQYAQGDTWYVLDDPPGGWSPEPTVEEQKILTILQQIGKGWRMGAIVGGVLGLGIVVWAARRRRSSP